MSEVLVTGPSGIVINGFQHTVHLISGAFALTSTGCNVVGNDAVAGTEAETGVIVDASSLTHSVGSIHGGAGSTADDLQGARGIWGPLPTSVSMSGGTITGGVIASGGLSGAPGMVLVDPGSLSFSGGTCTGSAAASGSNCQGGTAFVVSATSSNKTIAGGSWVGGAGDGTGPQGFSLGLNATNGYRIEITGGTFSGPVSANTSSGGYIRVSTGVSVVPVNPDGTSKTATSGVGHIDYT